MVNKKNNENLIKKRIEQILSEHPEGLTFVDIAKQLGMHRHSATKYIYELKGSGIVLIRDLGTLKLCYLKDMIKKRRKT